MFEHVRKYLSLSKDVVLTIGIPIVIYLMLQLHQAEVAVLNAKIDQLEMLTYDKAIDMVAAKDALQNEEKELLKRRIKMLGGEMDFDDLMSRYMCLKLKSRDEK